MEAKLYNQDIPWKNFGWGLWALPAQAASAEFPPSAPFSTQSVDDGSKCDRIYCDLDQGKRKTTICKEYPRFTFQRLVLRSLYYFATLWFYSLRASNSLWVRQFPSPSPWSVQPILPETQVSLRGVYLSEGQCIHTEGRCVDTLSPGTSIPSRLCIVSHADPYTVPLTLIFLLMGLLSSVIA